MFYKNKTLLQRKQLTKKIMKRNLKTSTIIKDRQDIQEESYEKLRKHVILYSASNYLKLLVS